MKTSSPILNCYARDFDSNGLDRLFFQLLHHCTVDAAALVNVLQLSSVSSQKIQGVCNAAQCRYFFPFFVQTDIDDCRRSMQVLKSC